MQKWSLCFSLVPHFPRMLSRIRWPLVWNNFKFLHRNRCDLRLCWKLPKAVVKSGKLSASKRTQKKEWCPYVVFLVLSFPSFTGVSGNLQHNQHPPVCLYTRLIFVICDWFWCFWQKFGSECQVILKSYKSLEPTALKDLSPWLSRFSALDRDNKIEIPGWSC